jgi:hypothetical protein
VLLFGSDYFVLIIPVVVALFGWIGLVFWASTRTRPRDVDVAAASVPAPGAADEDAGLGAGDGLVPPPRPQVSQPPAVARPEPPAQGDRTGSAPGR